MLAALGTALILLSGLSSYAILTASAQTRHVLVTTRHIARGEAIGAADLTTIEIAGAQSTPALPEEQIEAVAGQIATVELSSGALVTSEVIAPEPELPAGNAIVGIALGVEQLPGEPARPGDAVRIAAAPAQQEHPGDANIPVIPATVHAIRTDERSGLTIVDLRVPVETAPRLAAWAATGKVALILDAAGG